MEWTSRVASDVRLTRRAVYCVSSMSAVVYKRGCSSGRSAEAFPAEGIVSQINITCFDLVTLSLGLIISDDQARAA